MRGLCYSHHAQHLAIHLVVVCQYRDYDRRILWSIGGVIVRHRRIIFRVDSDNDRRRRGGAGGVTRCIGERVRPEVVGRGCVSYAVIGVHRQGSVSRRRCHTYRQRTVVNIGVVHQDTDYYTSVFAHRCAVVHRHRRVVDRIYGYTDCGHA